MPTGLRFSSLTVPQTHSCTGPVLPSPTQHHSLCAQRKRGEMSWAQTKICTWKPTSEVQGRARQPSPSWASNQLAAPWQIRFVYLLCSPHRFPVLSYFSHSEKTVDVFSCSVGYFSLGSSSGPPKTWADAAEMGAQCLTPEVVHPSSLCSASWSRPRESSLLNQRVNLF